MALATITETLELPADGSAATLRGTRARLRVVAADSGEAVAYSASVTTVSEAWVRVANDGTYSFTSVRPNTGSSGDQITDPAETVYELSIVYPSGAVTKRYLDVPDSAGPHDPADIEVNNPNTIRRWRSTDLYDVDATAATTTGELLVWNQSNTEFEVSTAGTASITDAAVTTAKLNDSAVTTAKINDDAITTAKIAAGAVDTTELAAEAVTSTKVDHTVGLNLQGRRHEGLTAWNAAWGAHASSPVRMVCLRDSHGELGVDGPFFTKARSRVTFRQDEPNIFSAAGRWNAPTYTSTVPVLYGGAAGTDLNTVGSHSGAGVSVSADGPMGHGCTYDTGDWFQFGGFAFTLNTGFTFWGVGTWDVSINGGAAESVTLAAGESWSSDVLALGANTMKLTATADGVVVWGSYIHLHDNTAGFQPYNLAHSGWKGSQAVAADKTWDLVADLDPALVLVGFATNQTSAADYSADIQAVIDEIVTAAPNASIVIWFPHLADLDDAWWDDAHDAAKQLARANGAVLVDNYVVMGDVSDDADPFDMSDDGVHLNAKGIAVSSSILAEVLLGADDPIRPVDASGVVPATSVRLREVYNGAGDVLLQGGTAVASSPLIVGYLASDGTTLVAFVGGDPPSTSSTYDGVLLNRRTGDGRYESARWLGFSDLDAVNGSPAARTNSQTSTSGNRLMPTWAMDAASEEAVGGSFIVPTGWKTCAIDVWVVHGSGAGNVVYQARYSGVNDGDSGTGATKPSSVTVANGTQYEHDIIQLATGISVTAGNLFRVAVARVAADAADTYASDHNIVGIRVRRLT